MLKLALTALALVIATPKVAAAKTKRLKHSHGYVATQSQQSCGTFMYRKNGKCEDARNKTKEWKIF